MTSMYQKISADSCGSADVEDYAAFLRRELAAEFPDVDVTIETTTMESGCMPCVIDANEGEDEEYIFEFLRSLWDKYCEQN